MHDLYLTLTNAHIPISLEINKTRRVTHSTTHSDREKESVENSQTLFKLASKMIDHRTSKKTTHLTSPFLHPARK